MNIQVGLKIGFLVKPFSTYITFKLDFLLMILFYVIFQLTLSIEL